MPAMLQIVAAGSPAAALVGEGLARVEAVFDGQLSSDLPFVNELCGHVERYRGKMLRPTLLLLSGMAAGGREGAIGDSHIVAAAVVEMVHMATLVHDDVLDEAEVRRRGATVNHLHGNETAIILGDYLISSAFHLCSSLDDQRVALRIGEVTRRVCEGELLQLRRRGSLDLGEGEYFTIIERKTAALIAAACELGARLAGADDDVARRLHAYGVKVGSAYQIQDDLLDLLGDEGVVGKSVGRDLDKGKATLPLLRTLERMGDAGGALRARLTRGERGAFAEARRLAISTGAAAEASGVAERLVDEAKAALAPLEASAALDLLLRLADASVRRRF